MSPAAIPGIGRARAVLWLVVVLMPFQTLTAFYLDVRGPLHFHVHDEDHAAHHAHGHHHGESHHHDRVERHHHHVHDSSVVAVDEGRESPTRETELESGWSGTMLVALLASNARPQLPAMKRGLARIDDVPIRTRFPPPIERPPRASRA
jgi:hypothetical protein